jgi:hypothetical protein
MVEKIKQSNQQDESDKQSYACSSLSLPETPTNL